MLLERFGLWDARASASAAFSRGMAQRLALCRALLHDPCCSCSTSRSPPSTRPVRRCSTVSSTACRRTARSSSPRTIPSAWPRSRPTGRLGVARDALRADVAALARKDLRLELRARDTLPAMLLFVLSTLVVFHFALPSGASDDAAYGMLWVAIVFTALLGLPARGYPSGSGGALDGLVLAPCDRSAIWLGKTLAVLAFLAAAELVALPAFALFFAPARRRRARRCGARRRRHLRRRLARSRRWPPRAEDARADSSAPVPPARDPAGRRRRRCRHLAERRKFLSFLGLYDVVFSHTCLGHVRICRHGITSSPRWRSRAAGADRPRTRPGAPSRRARGRKSGRLAADLLLPRPDRADRLRVFRPRRLEGAASPLGGGERRDLESYSCDPPGNDLRRADADHRLDLGEGIVGGWWDWRSNQLVLFLVLFLFYCAYFMLRFSLEQGARRERIQRGLRPLRGGADPGQLPRDQAGERLHPPDRVHPPRPADDRLHVRHVLRLLGRDHALAYVMYRVELLGKRTDSNLRELREALA